jgi:superfamily I DNA and/or RNA helicase
LENVQGDERDVIYFSIGYARDKKGNLSHNFGPLNREGGHRRLNVAITRARDRLKVFSSIVSSDIDLSRTSAQGAVLLKKYLGFAEAAVNGQRSAINANEICDQTLPFSCQPSPATSLIEESIAQTLEARGYVVDR